MSDQEAALEAAALVLERWLNRDAMLLAIGEMTAQEWRTVRAVLINRAATIRALASCSGDGAARDALPSDEDVDRVAYMLAKTCADFYGDQIPETFDMELSRLLARAAFTTIRALPSPPGKEK